MTWQTMENAPKDGTWIEAYGDAHPELAARGRRNVANSGNPRQVVPHQMLIKWVEIRQEKEVDLGDGTYRKELASLEAYWAPEPVAFIPTHWKPKSEPPAPQ